MKREELNYIYPESLIATEPSRPTRVLLAEEDKPAKEISLSELIELIPPHDVFVVNNTKVLKRRIFAGDLEVLFLDQLSESLNNNEWSVLFPSKKFKLGDHIQLPAGFSMELIEKGRPQKVRITPKITEADFERIAELPLPPYIQKARNERHNLFLDDKWYQTAWADKPGSFAAPTASLHFS